MNNNSINDEMIAGYLLGELPDEQAERLDELAVTDRDFFERVGWVENDLVDRYVNGELNGAESTRFDSHYLSSPLRQEKVRLARAFQEYGGRNLGVQSVATEAVTADAKPGVADRIAGFFASLRIFGGAQPAFRFAMAAAALLIVAFGGWFALRNLTGNRFGGDVASNISGNRMEPIVQPSPRPEFVEVPVNKDPLPSPTSAQPTPTPKPAVPQQTRPLIASFILSPPIRGTNVPSLKIPAETDKAAIRLELESDDFKSYTLELKEGASGRIIWRSGGSRAAGASGRRFLSASIPARSFKSSIYTISVSGLGDGGQPEIVGDYPFRVVR